MEGLIACQDQTVIIIIIIIILKNKDQDPFLFEREA